MLSVEFKGIILHFLSGDSSVPCPPLNSVFRENLPTALCGCQGLGAGVNAPRRAVCHPGLSPGCPALNYIPALVLCW